MKILIVEDDLMIAFQLKDDLEEAGHLVNAIVRNPFDALTALRNDPPDLAILDITLENGRDEGIELAKLLPNFGNLPFIFLTGRTDTYLMHLAEKAKPYAYLFKPYRKEELLMQISLAYNSFKEKSVELPANYDCFYLKNNGVHERIDYEALLYVKSNRHSVSIFTTHDRKPYVVGTNLSEIISYLTHPDLLLLSPSLIVNKKHIRQLYRKSLSLNHVAEDLEITDRGRKVLLNTLNILKTKSSKK